MKTLSLKKTAVISALLLTLFSKTQIFAERTGFTGFSNLISIDVPEHFVLKDKTPDNLSYLLEAEFLPVSVIIKFYKNTKISENSKLLSQTLVKLGLSKDRDFELCDFEYLGQTACIAGFNGMIAGEEKSGFAEALYLPEDKCTISIITAYPKEKEENCFLLASSFLDSLYINQISYFTPGPFTTFAFPQEEEKEIQLEIDGKSIKTKIFSTDEEAASYVVDREYTVLTYYQTSPYWQEAWKRYYRLIFRDSCGRLNRCIFDVSNVLAPDAADETDLAQKLLTWTQNMEYERESNSSDFVDLVSAITGKGCDCDTRSMLLSVFLQGLGIDSIMFVSAVHSHAIAGIVSDHPGFSFECEGKKYLTGETTKKGLTWGMIASDMQNQKDWIPVILP